MLCYQFEWHESLLLKIQLHSLIMSSHIARTKPMPLCLWGILQKVLGVLNVILKFSRTQSWFWGYCFRPYWIRSTFDNAFGLDACVHSVKSMHLLWQTHIQWDRQHKPSSHFLTPNSNNYANLIRSAAVNVQLVDHLMFFHRSYIVWGLLRLALNQLLKH